MFSFRSIRVRICQQQKRTIHLVTNGKLHAPDASFPLTPHVDNGHGESQRSENGTNGTGGEYVVQKQILLYTIQRQSQKELIKFPFKYTKWRCCNGIHWFYFYFILCVKYFQAEGMSNSEFIFFWVIRFNAHCLWFAQRRLCIWPFHRFRSAGFGFCLDARLVCSVDEKKHLRHLLRVFGRLVYWCSAINADTCQFGRQCVGVEKINDL